MKDGGKGWEAMKRIERVRKKRSEEEKGERTRRWK